MTATEVRRMNWGCGDDRPEGWINSDRKEGPGIQLTADILEGFPLESESIDYIVSVHALQEVPPENLVAVLTELRRVLKPGGVLRLVLPDAVKGFEAFCRGERDYFAVPDEDAESVGGKLALQLTWYGYSRSLFTPDWIEELLRRAGFSQVNHCAHGVTRSLYQGIVELDNRENESLFVEAMKGDASSGVAKASPLIALLAMMDHVIPVERAMGLASEWSELGMCV